ncbi:ATP-binding protein [Actinomadura monticuli]|uniref:histidine kinase n=1 Tax=Actinomadura monticuli TaxID=3097367 RepID=A0ABV4Q4F9_9ACTN
MTTRPVQAPIRPGGEEPSGQVRDHARELVERLEARGLRASVVVNRADPAGAIAVTAQRVDVRPYAGRTVFLLPAEELGGLYWHWRRRFPDHLRTKACWFQPFCRAGDIVTAVDAVVAAIDADVRARARLAHAAVIGPDAAEEPDREVLVYVGYRVHSLVSRMLARLKAIEKEYEDPDLLDELYALDHMATQLRRAAERLAVLGGVTARRAKSPMLLSTVLRQAIAEVEQFRRVGLVLPERDVPVVGHAGPSIIHVLAELVENATRFSRHDSPVLMAPVEIADGLGVEIRDRGLPLSAEKLEDLRRILAEPHEISSREQVRQGQIGMLVVARLAARLGLRVELHPEESGTRALVVLPPALLADAAPVSTPAAGSVQGPVQSLAWHARELPRPTRAAVSAEFPSDGPLPAPLSTADAVPASAVAESPSKEVAPTEAGGEASPHPPSEDRCTETSELSHDGKPALPRRSQAGPSAQPPRPAEEVSAQAPVRPPSPGLMAAFTAGIRKGQATAPQDDTTQPQTD